MLNFIFRVCAFLLVTSSVYGQSNQIRTIDVGFGSYSELSYGTWVIDFIEKNEPHRVFNYLSDQSELEYEDILDMSSFIQSFHKVDGSYPPLMANFKYSGDTLFYERHYFTEEGGEINYIAQLLVAIVMGGAEQNVVDIKLYRSNEFLKRDLEIASLNNGTWHQHMQTALLPDSSIVFTQESAVELAEFDRNIERIYVNDDYNFGFDYDTLIWRISTDNEFLDWSKYLYNDLHNLKILESLNLVGHPNLSYPMITVFRSELTRPIGSLLDLSEDLNAGLLSASNSAVNFTINEIDIVNSSVDEERNLLTNKLLVENNSDQKYIIMQSIFFVEYNEAYFIQLVCEEEEITELLIRNYNDCVESFVIK